MEESKADNGLDLYPAEDVPVSGGDLAVDNIAPQASLTNNNMHDNQEDNGLNMSPLENLVGMN